MIMSAIIHSNAANLKNINYDVKVTIESVGDFTFTLTSLVDFEKTIDQLFAKLPEENLEAITSTLCPYFGSLWPSAKALAREVNHLGSTFFKDRSILEVGCGLAFPSMVLSKMKIPSLASDIHPDAEVFVRKNIEQNGLKDMDYINADWRSPNAFGKRKFDIILASDVLYDKDQPETLYQFLTQTLSHNGSAIVADPKRPHFSQFISLCEKSFVCNIKEVIVATTDKNSLIQKPIDIVTLMQK